MQWYCKIIMLSCLCAFVFVGCVPKTKTGNGGKQGEVSKVVPVADSGHSVVRKNRSTRIGVAVEAAVGGVTGTGVVKMMDIQEQEMRSVLAHSEAAAIHRKGDLLSVSLKGDLAFDKNSAAVRPGLFAEIERMTNILNRYPKTVIQVGGYTDSQGSEAYNLTLSKQRADAVKNLMAQLGISQARIEAVALGEAQPIASNDTESGRVMNRRVEINIAPSLR